MKDEEYKYYGLTEKQANFLAPTTEVFGFPKPGITGLDELAQKIGLESYKNGSGDNIVLLGKSGNSYPLIELLAKFIEYVKRVAG